MKSLRGLLFERGGDSVSVGRVAFWAVFILAMVLWALEKEVSVYQFLTMNFLLLYNLGKKAVWAFIEMRKLICGGTVDTTGATSNSTQTEL